jgi:hypothetical protein
MGKAATTKRWFTPESNLFTHLDGLQLNCGASHIVITSAARHTRATAEIIWHTKPEPANPVTAITLNKAAAPVRAVTSLERVRSVALSINTKAAAPQPGKSWERFANKVASATSVPIKIIIRFVAGSVNLIGSLLACGLTSEVCRGAPKSGGQPQYPGRTRGWFDEQGAVGDNLQNSSGCSEWVVVSFLI